MIDERLAKRALMSWGVGRSYLAGDTSSGAAVAMIEDAAHVSEALQTGVVREGGVLFIPESAGVTRGPEHFSLLNYQGHPSEPAGELTVGEDVFVQIQDYATAEYMSVIGPTLLRMLVPEDFPALIGDLDRAVNDGKFPDHLVHPASQLADRSSLGGTTAVDGPSTRLHLRSDGTWSVSPLGAPLGTLGDGFDALQEVWLRQENQKTAEGIALGRVVPEHLRTAAFLDRPWIGHAISAVSAMQDLAARGIYGSAVSGFGGRLNPALTEWPTAATSDWHTVHSSTPVLCWTEDMAYLHLPDSGRTFQIDLESALAFEAVLTTGSAEEAARFCPAEVAQAAAARLAAFGLSMPQSAS